MKRSRKNRTTGNIVIMVSTILLLNLVGVSYAFFTDSLQMSSLVSTGNLDLAFQDMGSKTILLDICLNDETTVLGSVDNNEEGLNNTKIQGDFNLTIANQGSIPVKLISRNITLKGDGLGLDVEMIPGIIQSQANSSISGTISVPAGVDLTDYDFTIELLYGQIQK